MIDKRLIDYSKDYKDYKKTLKQEGQHFSLEDIMTLVEGFLQGKALIHETMETLGKRDVAALANLEEAYSQYSD
jgi:hypothetical protein